MYFASCECAWMIHNTNWRSHEPLGKLWLHFSSSLFTPPCLAFVTNQQEKDIQQIERVRKSLRVRVCLLLKSILEIQCEYILLAGLQLKIIFILNQSANYFLNKSIDCLVYKMSVSIVKTLDQQSKIFGLKWYHTEKKQQILTLEKSRMFTDLHN